MKLCSDALSAAAPHINALKSFGYHFIIVVKPEGNKTLYGWVKGITREVKVTVGRNKYIFRYVNNIPLNNTSDAPNVNFFECDLLKNILTFLEKPIFCCSR